MRKGKLLSALLCATLCMSGCASRRTSGMAALRAGIDTGFINKTVLVDEKPCPYVVYVPREYDPEKSWPLILFLHGAGERGHDGLAQTDVGIGHAIRRDPDRFPCIVLMPQCPPKVWWDAAVERVEQAFARTLHEYSIDRSRIYLTGISMGGYAVWRYGAKKADTFAALIPICGGGNPEDASALASVPIWAFHGADDDVIDPQESRTMVEAVRAAGGEVQYTEFKETGHVCWDKVYGDPKVIKWLLRQRRGH